MRQEYILAKVRPMDDFLSYQAMALVYRDDDVRSKGKNAIIPTGASRRHDRDVDPRA
jgi:hypothetical protein